MLILIRQWLINVIGHAHFNQNRCGQFDPLHSRGASYAPVVYVLLFFWFVFLFLFLLQLAVKRLHENSPPNLKFDSRAG